jgi:hypothetical protein
MLWERIVTLERRLETVKRIAGPVRPLVDAARRVRERSARPSL